MVGIAGGYYVADFEGKLILLWNLEVYRMILLFTFTNCNLSGCLLSFGFLSRLNMRAEQGSKCLFYKHDLSLLALKSLSV